MLLVGILVGILFGMRLMQGRGREAKVQGFDCGAFRGVSHALEWGKQKYGLEFRLVHSRSRRLVFGLMITSLTSHYDTNQAIVANHY